MARPDHGFGIGLVVGGRHDPLGFAGGLDGRRVGHVVPKEWSLVRPQAQPEQVVVARARAPANRACSSAQAGGRVHRESFRRLGRPRDQ
jgi:hypothetical protein